MNITTSEQTKLKTIKIVIGDRYLWTASCSYGYWEGKYLFLKYVSLELDVNKIIFWFCFHELLRNKRKGKNYEQQVCVKE